MRDGTPDDRNEPRSEESYSWICRGVVYGLLTGTVRMAMIGTESVRQQSLELAWKVPGSVDIGCRVRYDAVRSVSMNELELAHDERRPVPYRHQRRQLVLLTLVYLGAISLIWFAARNIVVDPFDNDYWYVSDSAETLASLGGTLLLAELLVVLLTDWRGFTTLRGRLNWHRLTPAAVVFGLMAIFLLFGLFPFVVFGPLMAFGFPLFVFGPISGFPATLSMVALGLYIVLSIIDHRTARRRAPLDQELRIAELEAELGIPPATRGNCRDCAKPLQLGAHYCGYCRTPVVPKLRNCPSCEATALPDASWCPKCGMALDGAKSLQA